MQTEESKNTGAEQYPEIVIEVDIEEVQKALMQNGIDGTLENAQKFIELGGLKDIGNVIRENYLSDFLSDMVTNYEEELKEG